MFAASQQKEERGNINSRRRGGKAKEFPLSIVRKCDNNASRRSSRSSLPPFVGLGREGENYFSLYISSFCLFSLYYSENNSFSPSFNCPAITQKLLWTEGRFLLCTYQRRHSKKKVLDRSGGKLSLFPFSAGERTQEFTGKTLSVSVRSVGTGNLFPSWRL